MSTRTEDYYLKDCMKGQSLILMTTGRSHQDAWFSDAALHLVLHNFTFFGRVASPSDDCCCCFAGDSIGGVSVRSKLVSSHEVGSFSDSKCVNTVTLGNAWRMSASILSNSR